MPYYKVLLRTTPTETTSERPPSSTTQVLQSTTPVLLHHTTKYYSSTTSYYKVLLRTTKYYSTTTKYYTRILLYYNVLLQYYSVLQSTTPTSGTTSERFSSNKLPKRAFRARLPQLLKQQASKTSISCEASFKFHTFNSKIDDFMRVFLIKPFLQSSKSMSFAKLPPLFKTLTKCCACHDICKGVTFAHPCHCDSSKKHFHRITKCCACHDIAKGHITKCCACHEKTTRLH